MSDFRGIMKGGWHPKGKDGGKESWRGDFKGINQVAGWMGKGKQPGSEAADEHVSRPLATLKDPSSFGPPPKNVNYHGGAALPNEITPHRSGLGAPLTQEQIQNAEHAARGAEEEEQNKPAPPPLPFRSDRTGLKTDHLPPPPVHRDVQHRGLASANEKSQQPPKSQPHLPPRLPARQNTASSPVEPPPPAYDSLPPTAAATPSLNQSAIGRLGKAGVSVPGLGIGSNNTSTNQSQSGNQLSELQNRFSRMNTNSSPRSPQQAPENPWAQEKSQSPQPQQNMPSLQQSQSAFQTAQNLRTNPQSVTVADAQAAAQTAGQAQRSYGQFREKHADSISKAQNKAKAIDQKYKFTSKLNKWMDENTEPENANQQGAAGQPQQTPLGHQQQSNNEYVAPAAVPIQPSPQLQASSQQNTGQQSQSPRQSSEMMASITRKPPPPPPPKKPASMQAPPPVPLGTKPSFG